MAKARKSGGAGSALGNGVPQLDNEWRRWIAENILLGAGDDQLAAALAGRGCPQAVIGAELAAARASPYLAGAGTLGARLQKRDWLLESYARLDSLTGGGVPRAHQLPADRFLTDHYAAHRPVLLTGLIDHWPALTRWSLDYFAETLGDPMIQVQKGRDQDPAYELNSEKLRVLEPLSAVIARLREDRPSNDFYVTANNNSHNRQALGALWADIGDIPGYLVPQPERDGFFWMGPRGTITPFHHDLTNNLLMQVRGRKKVTLVPSWETPRMRNHVHCFSQFAGPAEITALPPGERPQLIECVIGPGEILFIPVGWWHHVEGLDMTIGLSFTNFAWDNDFSSFYSSHGRL